MLDAAVIGAGPAGCSAAVTLAKQGWKTALIEKSPLARHKICGEFFSPGAWPLLRRLGAAEKMLEAGGVPIHTASLHFPLQAPHRFKLPSASAAPFALGLSRLRFDALLAGLARETGCALYEETEVLSVREEKSFCRIVMKDGREVEARYVVNAAGKISRLSRARPAGQTGFKAHFQNARKPDGLEMYFFQGGYLGLIEIEEGKVNLCGMVGKQPVLDCRGSFDELVRRAAGKNARLRGWLGSAIRVTPWISCAAPRGFQNADTRRVLYAGDSACFVEPMIGQGMTLALYNGIKTAEDLLAGQKKGRGRKPYRAKMNYLKLFEPAARFCSRFPSFAKPAAKLFLRDSVLRNILSTPG